jgi:cysteine desulfurase/selenocysteine lyase
MTSASTLLQAPRPAGALDVGRIRADFPILNLEINGKPLAYLDNAASSQMPTQVIDRLVRYQTSEHSNIHRAVHTLSERATAEYECAPQDPAFHQRERRTRSHLHRGTTNR